MLKFQVLTNPPQPLPPREGRPPPCFGLTVVTLDMGNSPYRPFPYRGAFQPVVAFRPERTQTRADALKVRPRRYTLASNQIYSPRRIAMQTNKQWVKLGKGISLAGVSIRICLYPRGKVTTVLAAGDLTKPVTLEGCHHLR